ncbi:PTS transporter subunit EIIA [bacterium]|nr:PTS transporter subunit EIIA [bacterium]
MRFINEHNILIFLIQIVILLFSAKAAGELFRRLKQPALVGEILVGIIFGPTVLGRLLPGIESFLFPDDQAQKSMFETASWLGVFFLLLVTGFEVDASVIWREKRSSAIIGLSSMVAPLILGASAAFLIRPMVKSAATGTVVFSLLLGTITAISAVPVLVKVLHDYEILKSDFGLVALASSSVKDILGWALFTVVLGIGAEQRLNLLDALKVFGGTSLFLLLSFTLGKYLVSKAVLWINRSHLPKPGSILSFIVVMGAICGAVTQAIGIHAAFGFLAAGILAGEAKGIMERTRETVSQFVNAVFVPLFFVSIGINVDFLSNFNPTLVLLVSAVAIAGKFAGAWLGAKLSRMPSREAVAMGVAHIPGGAMEIIMGMLALQFGLIDTQLFEAVVVASIISSLLLSPLLYLSLGLRKDFNASLFLLETAAVAELSGNTPREAIGELCNSISLHEGMPGSAESCAAVDFREGILGTGMEKGIAIPHARLNTVSQPVLTLGRSLKGIEWNTSDGLPVNLVFLLLTPEDDKEDLQVKILAAIARTMESSKVRHEMLSAKTAEEMVKAFTAALREDRMKMLRSR